MADINTHHATDLAHHIHQGRAWLSASAEGENSAMLSYAALELRFAIERLGVHYWATLHYRRSEGRDFRDIESFRWIEGRIYELGGYQKEINGHFEFMRLMLQSLNSDKILHTPNIGQLSNHWHECSELCHIAWPLKCSAPKLRTRAFRKLTEISDSLSQHVSSLGWPQLRDATFTDLRNRFVAGNATADDVRAHLETTGLWPQAPIPPNPA